MAIDDQLTELLVRQADLFTTLEDRQNAEIMLIAGTVDDPDSFNETGGKTGALGYYPIVNVNGQTMFFPCQARMKAIAMGSASATAAIVEEIAPSAVVDREPRRYFATATSGSLLQGFGAYPTDPNFIKAFVITEQSLGEGVNTSNDPAISTGPARYPGKMLMPALGLRPRLYEGTPITAFGDLVEYDNGDNLRQSLASSIAWSYNKAIFDAIGHMPTTLVMICARSGQSDANTKRGGTWDQAGGGQIYDQSILRIQECEQVARAQGLRLSWDEISVGGEEDTGLRMPPSIFRRRLQRKRAHRQADIYAINQQPEPVRLYFPVTNKSVSAGYGHRPGPMLAQAQGWDGDNLHVPLGSNYSDPRGPRDVHPLSLSTLHGGERFGTMIAKHDTGLGAIPPRVLYAAAGSSDGKTILLFCETETDLIIDTTGQVSPVGLGAGLGIDVVNGDLTPLPIASIAIQRDPTQVSKLLSVIRVTLISSQYDNFDVHVHGGTRCTLAGLTGPVDGPRMCIRNKNPLVSLQDGAPLYDWLMPFVHPVSLPKGEPSIGFDFTAGLPAGATFARSSTTTCIDSTGVRVTIAANTPAIEYSPATRFALGLRVDGAASNLATYSEQIDNAAWTKTGLSITPNAAIGPDSATSMDKLVETATTGFHRISRNLTSTAGQRWSVSGVFQAAWVATDGGPAPRTRLTLRLSGTNPYAAALFDLESVTALVTAGEAGIEDFGDGRFYVWVSGIADSTATALQASLNDATGTSYLGVPGNGMLASELQFEAGRPSGYAKSEAAAGTHAAAIVALGWDTKGIGDGVRNVVWTFGDGSTQAGTITVASGKSTIPTTLNRTIIRKVRLA